MWSWSGPIYDTSIHFVNLPRFLHKVKLLFLSDVSVFLTLSCFQILFSGTWNNYSTKSELSEVWLLPRVLNQSHCRILTRSLLAGTSATNRLFDDVVIFFAASESFAKIKDSTKNCKSKNLATTQGSEYSSERDNPYPLVHSKDWLAQIVNLTDLPSAWIPRLKSC